MPTWWIVGVAVYIPLFVGGSVAMVRQGDEPMDVLVGGTVFLVLSTLAAVFWFG